MPVERRPDPQVRLGKNRRIDRGIDIIGGLLVLSTFVAIGLSLTSPIVRRLAPLMLQP